MDGWVNGQSSKGAAAVGGLGRLWDPGIWDRAEGPAVSAGVRVCHLYPTQLILREGRQTVKQ